MELERAIEIITNAIQTGNYTAERDKALALVQKAVEKQAPKKVAYTPDFNFTSPYHCPYCDTALVVDYKDNYCFKCGQALDWSKEEWEE